MGSYFEAARGQMGELEFYVTSMRLGEVAKSVGYAEREVGGGAETTPELLRQRKLNMSRVRQDMVPYLVDKPDHFFSALTVEIVPVDPDTLPRFEAGADSPDFGRIVLDGSERLQAIDGQHRLKAIQLALEEQPELAKESVAVVLIPHRGVKRSQQLFSDLNRYAKNPSKTLNILFEHREFEANVAKLWASHCLAFRDGRTNMETNSLVAKSRHIITLSVLYECVRDLLDRNYTKKVWANRASMEVDALAVGREFAECYDEIVVPSLPELGAVIAGKVKPVEVRSRYIYSHSVGWRAIAQAISRAKLQRTNWKDVVEQGVKAIDWRLANPEWEGSAMVAGTVANRRQNIARAAVVVALKMGLNVTDEERDDLIKTLRYYQPEAELPLPAVERLAS